MTTFRLRTNIAMLFVAAAGLSACTNDSTSPLEPAVQAPISATVDSARRSGPTIPWTSVRKVTPGQTRG